MSNYKLSNGLVFAYRTAMSQGKWRNTYAATDEKEYWAIGVQGMILFQAKDGVMSVLHPWRKKDSFTRTRCHMC